MNMYNNSYSRSIPDRIKIRLEIIYENCLDFLSHHALRKPIIAFAGIAVFVTLRNSKHIVATLKHSSYMSPFNTRFSSSSVLGSSYGSSTLNSYGNARLASSSSGGYGGSSYAGSSYAGTTSYANPSSTTYGTGSTSPYQYGQSTTATQSVGSSTYNSNLRGGAPATTSSSFSTSRLVDQYKGSVQIVQGGLFHDYGMVTSFSGQVDTISAMESPALVQQTLSTPGKDSINNLI